VNTTERERVKELLSQAAGLAPERRRAFVEEAAGSDAAIAAETLRLLHTIDSTTGGSRALVTALQAIGERPGTRIDRYELQQQLGEGGFGTVFLARQNEPVVRQVALKVIKLGMDTREVIARFEAERQALALMDHPNIARVLDGGATTSGRPYFVMELVHGEPITRYCDRLQLSIAQRLGLFEDVCHAVQHAHQKGVIHRDLKPSNVLVSDAAGRALPKVIDFGIAKATAGRLTDKTVFTEYHQRLGTPEYMSPEQADPSIADIDTRSDVYSLGVLLYELLTGMTPFAARGLAAANHDALLRRIREEDPPRPSLRLQTLMPWRSDSESSSSAQDIARCRGTQPVSLARSLSGDLDWIVMKCLEKDRQRRYETAAALADDVHRYLTRQPVLATPASPSYRLRRFVRRHRGSVLAGGAIAATLVAATGVSILFAVRALEQRRQAQRSAEQTRLVAQFQSALLAGIDAEAMGRGIKDRFREQVRAGLARQYVGESPSRRPRTPEEIDGELAAYDGLTSGAAPADVARGVLDEYVLGNAAETVETRFAEQPGVQAELLTTLGTVYHSLAQFDKAEPLLRRSLELRQDSTAPPDPDDPADARITTQLAAALSATGRHQEAEELYLQALAVLRRDADAHPTMLIEALNNVAAMRSAQGDHAHAETLLTEAVELARDLPPDQREATLDDSLSNLGTLHAHQGEYEKAEAEMREALALRQERLGGEHADIALTLANLGGVLAKRGDLAGAGKMLQDSLTLSRARLGDDHPHTTLAMVNLGSVLIGLDDRAGAIALCRDALAINRRVLGDAHPETALSLNNLAVALQRNGDLEAAEPLLRESLSLRRARLGDQHPDVAQTLGNLGRCLQRRGDPAAALPLYLEAEAICRQSMAPTHELSVGVGIGLARVQVQLGLLDEAETRLTAIDDATSGSAAMPAKLRQALFEIFIDLYEARHAADPQGGHDERAAQWRARLAELQAPAP
jgi:serine/threonine protein kinase/tetratricopeptide (TPR) repeat protein